MTGNTASTGGSSLSVMGLNFGTFDLTATATIRAADCRSTSWFSATSISCNTANLIAPTVSVTVSRLPGTGATFFCYDAAVLSYSFLNIAPSGGSLLTVSGLNFGAYASTATRDMEGYSCSSTTWTTSTSVACLDQLRISGWPLRSRGYMMATVGALAGTGSSVVSFDSPILSCVDRNMVLSNVRQVTVGGLNFGIEVYTQSAGSLGAACRTTAWTSSTSVQCGIDTFTVSIASKLQLTVNTVLGSANLWGFSLDGPVVSSVMQNSPLSGGASVTVYGLSFGTEETTVSTPTVPSRLALPLTWRRKVMCWWRSGRARRSKWRRSSPPAASARWSGTRTWAATCAASPSASLPARRKNNDWKVMARGLHTSRKRFLPFVLVPGTTLRQGTTWC